MGHFFRCSLFYDCARGDPLTDRENADDYTKAQTYLGYMPMVYYAAFDQFLLLPPTMTNTVLVVGLMLLSHPLIIHLFCVSADNLPNKQAVQSKLVYAGFR